MCEQHTPQTTTSNMLLASWDTSQPTCVNVMPLDSAVGIQQNTARPTASSGGCSGTLIASRATSGVRNRMDSMPYVTAPDVMERNRTTVHS